MAHPPPPARSPIRMAGAGAQPGPERRDWMATFRGSGPAQLRTLSGRRPLLTPTSTSVSSGWACPVRDRVGLGSKRVIIFGPGSLSRTTSSNKAKG